MKDLLSLSGLHRDEVFELFRLADELSAGKHKDALKGKTAVLFFPSTSLRTRVSFEKGIHALGGQAILFPSETLEKREELRDVCAYLDNWCDVIVARHKSMALLEKLAACAAVPVINAMTDSAHPCEILSDLYALSKLRRDITRDNYLFCGTDGNIGRTWKEAAALLGFELSQCCPEGFEMPNTRVYHTISEAVVGKDIICTDSLPAAALKKAGDIRVTRSAMDRANRGALLNPCPPFYRGEEVSEDAIASDISSDTASSGIS